MENIQLYGQLGDIDEQIQRLVAERKKIVEKIHHSEVLKAMHARGSMFSQILAKLASIDDPVASLAQANNVIVPWRHNLPQSYFENTIQATEGGFPSNWSRAKASAYFTTLAKALENDMQLLQKMPS